MAPVFEKSKLEEYAIESAYSAAIRLYAFCATPWLGSMVQRAVAQLSDESLKLTLHLRRLSEINGKRINREIVPFYMREDSEQHDHERDLWTAINRIVHHTALEPTTGVERRASDDGAKIGSAYWVVDLVVTSDRGRSRINVPAFAAAAIEELLEQTKTIGQEPAKGNH